MKVMNKPLVATLLVLVLVLAAPAVSIGTRIAAQENQGEAATGAGNDPFDISAFDSGVTAAADAGKTGRVEILTGGTLMPAVSAIAANGFGGYSSTSSLSGKVFGKVTLEDYGSLFISYSISQYFLQARGGDAPAMVAKNLFTPTFALTELHYSFDLGKKLFIRLGNQLIAWGPSFIWTPVDFINTQKSDFFQAVDLRVGKPGLRLHLPMESSNLFAFVDFSETVKSGTVQDIGDTANLGFRYDLTLAGFELGLTTYFGSSVQARGGFDFSGRMLGMTLYGEVAVLPAYSAYSSSWSAVLGFERKLGDLKKATFSGEFFYNSAGADDENAYPAPPVTFSPTYVGKYYAYLGLTVSELFSPDLSTTVSALANISDASMYLRLAEDFNINGAPPFSLVVGWTGGGTKKAFTYYAGNNSLSLTVQSRIAF